MKVKKKIFLCLLFVLFFAINGFAGISENYKSWPEVIASGGGKTDSANYSAMGISGQLSIGTGQSETYIIRAGIFSKISAEIPMVSFSSAAYLTTENKNATITVILSNASTQTVSVDYATSDGTALYGEDYVTTSGTLIFNPGEISKIFEVTIIDDSVNEANETVNLILSNPINATFGTPNEATLTITDNDVPPSGGGGGGCFIATAVFGSPLSKQVIILKQFRDKYLLTNRIGKAFVRWYYIHSPKAAEFIRKNIWFKIIVKTFLYPIVFFSYLLVKLPFLSFFIFLIITISIFLRIKRPICKT